MNNSFTDKIVLASASVARRQMLRSVGLEFIMTTSNLDESVIKVAAKADKISPAKVAVQLAEAKAAAVAPYYRGHWIIGADQILTCANKLIDKVYNRKEAWKTLEFLSGRYHELHTAACVMRGAKVEWRYVDTAKLWMRTLTRDYIKGYLDQAGDEVLSSVGCYQIEDLGAQLFERVQGDQFSIQGMPLLPLVAFLQSRGLMPK